MKKNHTRIVKLGSRSVPGQVQVRSRLGPGHFQVNSKCLNLKSLRDLDLELEAIIAMYPPPPPPVQYSITAADVICIMLYIDSSLAVYMWFRIFVL